MLNIILEWIKNNEIFLSAVIGYSIYFLFVFLIIIFLKFFFWDPVLYILSPYIIRFVEYIIISISTIIKKSIFYLKEFYNRWTKE
jgi:hypothetical protein